MSAALDVRKCFALASLFACGQSDGVRVAQKCAVRSIARKPRCPQKKKKHEQSSCLSFCGAVYAKQMVLSHRCFALDTACPICLLCPLRLMSANALRLRLSLLAVSRTESELRKNAPCEVSHASLGVRKKKKKHEQSSCLSFCGAVTET